MQMKYLYRALVLTMTACVLHGQTGRPAFDAASVKPSDGRGGTYIKTDGRQFTGACGLSCFIQVAYGIEAWQLAGGPAWMERDLYAIEATTSEDLSGDEKVMMGGRPAPRRMAEMLQSLLNERFHLRVRRETRQVNVFSLIVARDGPKMKPPANTSDSRVMTMQGSTIPGARTTVTKSDNASMDQLARYLQSHMKGPVKNDTGLKDNYSFSFEYLYDDSQAGDAPQFLTALQDATGLKLQSAKGPVEFVVVDRADRPDAN
jgi:uncharacterized protein (TIGR03435 family)